LLRWTVLACCLPYPGDPKSAIDCFFLFGISLHPGVTGSAPHWKFRGCRVHSFPSPQELLRPASWLALLSRTFTFELAPTRSPSISVEYDYVDKQSIPTAGLSPASPTALWAAGHRISLDLAISDLSRFLSPSGYWTRVRAYFTTVFARNSFRLPSRSTKKTGTFLGGTIFAI